MSCLMLRGLITMVVLFYMPAALAVDSYRYAHVTIETPWMIFLFLLVIVMLPFILMAILYWYFATKKESDSGESK